MKDWQRDQLYGMGHWKSLSDLPKGWWTHGMPNDMGGYQALSECAVLDRPVPLLLDTGPAGNTIP